jgi:FAD/FMN-containing dehydrogenase
MFDSNVRMSRRTALKGAAVGGVGLVASGALGESMSIGAAEPPEALTMSNDEWFAQRAWSVSANKVLPKADGTSPPVTSLAKRIHRPRSAEEIAAIVKSLPATTPIACVCGGHESSGAALVASRDAVILDLIDLKSIEFEPTGGETLVTVGSGVVFRELVEAVKAHGGALPVGTGPGVGVAGYVTNGGLSSYFSRRLGLLGQRVERMTVVTADGDIRVLTPKDELFTAMLGAGSTLGIVVDMTFRMAEASTIQGAEQLVFGFQTRAQAVEFSRKAMQFMKEKVIPNDSVSLEIVVTGTKALVATTVFYDTFQGDAAEFVKPLQDLAASLDLPTLAAAHWGSWYEAAAALWPVIAEQKGNPLATSYHCAGTVGVPEDTVLDFVGDVVVGEAPLDEAPLSIVEIRTLGGEAQKGRRIPSGNCHHGFFVDLVTLYDASTKSPAERQAIADLTNQVVDKARAVPGLGVDFSGTHSQPDDIDRAAVAVEIFGSAAMARTVEAQKKQVDPNNRFRFNPFAKFVG